MENVQPWNPLFAPNAQVLPGANLQASQAVMRPGLDASTGVATQNSQEAKSSGRRELPEVNECPFLFYGALIEIFDIR